MLYLQQYVQMQAQHLSVGTPYKTDANVQPRGVSMIMSSENPGAGVPYGMMPQLTTLQIGSSVSTLDSISDYYARLWTNSCEQHPRLQYISPTYPYYAPTPSIIHTMQMGDSEQVSTAASPDEAYTTQYQHAPK